MEKKPSLSGLAIAEEFKLSILGWSATGLMKTSKLPVSASIISLGFFCSYTKGVKAILVVPEKLFSGLKSMFLIAFFKLVLKFYKFRFGSATLNS